MMNILSEFLLWMSRSGNKRKVGVDRLPAEPLSPRTSARHLVKNRRILRDLGYVNKDISSPARHPERWLVNQDKDIRQMSIEEVEGWFQAHFPPGDRTPQEKARWNDYAGAFRKFAEFMHYGKGLWSRDKLEEIRRRVLILDVSYPELEIVEPTKAHAFQQWLETQPRYYVHAIMLYLMQWLGMRYLEVVTAKAGLDGPTLKIDWPKRWVTIWGKGRGGLSKQRSLPLRDEAAEKIKGYLAWRRKRGINSDRLFVTSWGRPWAEQSWGYNKTVRTNGLPKYNEWIHSQGLPHLAFSDAEIQKMTTHKMGRHVFGTVYASQLPAKTLMEYMGITKFSVVQRYINFSKAEKVEQFERATQSIMRNGANGKGRSEGGMPIADLIEKLKATAP